MASDDEKEIRMSEACSHQHGACCSSHDHHAHEALPAKAQTHPEEACGCHGGVPVFDGVDPRYKRVLWTVILINAAMFVTEIVAGHLAGSQALQADALDFLGDTVTYGLSLAVIGASLRNRATAALFKGLSLSLMGAWVLGSTLYHVLILGLPRAEIMGAIGLLALAANVTSVLLLMRYKDGDANVRSVWLCSRNDAIGNVVVTGAAGAVWWTASAWPDLIVAGLMAGLFLSSAVQILRQAWTEYRSTDPVSPVPAE
jgi:Co/Zn/Cd efflux system component